MGCRKFLYTSMVRRWIDAEKMKLIYIDLRMGTVTIYCRTLCQEDKTILLFVLIIENSM